MQKTLKFNISNLFRMQVEPYNVMSSFVPDIEMEDTLPEIGWIIINLP